MIPFISDVQKRQTPTGRKQISVGLRWGVRVRIICKWVLGTFLEEHGNVLKLDGRLWNVMYVKCISIKLAEKNRIFNQSNVSILPGLLGPTPLQVFETYANQWKIYLIRLFKNVPQTYHSSSPHLKFKITYSWTEIHLDPLNSSWMNSRKEGLRVDWYQPQPRPCGL
jgi:hypothetical protein